MARVFDRHDWKNRTNAWAIKHRRWWMYNVDPPGELDARATADFDERVTADGDLRVVLVRG